MNALPFYDDRYTKPKTRTSGDKVYTNFRSLNVPEDGVDCESFIVIPIHSLLIYENKYYLQRIFRQLHLQSLDKKMITIFLGLGYINAILL